MEKSSVETNDISVNPVNKMSKDEAKIKCHGDVRSRYLREPRGSCHNLCKYGKKHEPEHDEKHLTSRRFMANNIALEAVQNLVKRSTAVDFDTPKVMEQTIQNSLSKHRRTVSSPQVNLPEHSRQHTGSLAKKIGLFDNYIGIVSEAHSPTHRRIESVEEELIPRNLEQKIQTPVEDDEKAQKHSKEIVQSKNNINVDRRALSLESKRIEIKSKALSMPKSAPIKGNILKQKNSSTSTEADSGGNTNIFEKKVWSNQKESTTLTTLKEIKQKDMVFRKQSASSMLQSNNQSAAHLSSKTNGSAMAEVPLNVRNPLVRSISQLNTSRSMNGRVNREDKSLHDNEISEVGETKLLMPQRSSISSTISAGGTVSLKARKSRYAQHAMLKKFGKAIDDRGDFKEKALKIIDPKIEGKGLKSKENLSKELGRHAFDSAVCDTSEPPSNGQIQRKYKCSVATKEEDKRWQRRTPVAKQPTESSSSPYKLKFKKGKVIELRTADSVVPRRLGLKRGKVLGENPSAEITKRSFRRKRDLGGSNEHNSKAQSAKLKKANLESKLGLLKYQDALGKKEIRALLNDVIEETANKLVEIRKSKVKALVGAFETVISFQETKPASMV